MNWKVFYLRYFAESFCRIIFSDSINFISEAIWVCSFLSETFSVSLLHTRLFKLSISCVTFGNLGHLRNFPFSRVVEFIGKVVQNIALLLTFSYL